VLAKPRSIADMLKAYGKALPINSPGKSLVRDVEKIQEAIRGGLKEYDKVMHKYPGLIAPKDTFAGPEQAYAAVLERSQEYALDQLKEMTVRLGKTEGKTVTMTELLQRYGYKVATSNFSAIKADVAAGRRRRQARNEHPRSGAESAPMLDQCHDFHVAMVAHDKAIFLCSSRIDSAAVIARADWRSPVFDFSSPPGRVHPSSPVAGASERCCVAGASSVTGASTRPAISSARSSASPQPDVAAQVQRRGTQGGLSRMQRQPPVHNAIVPRSDVPTDRATHLP
jgi:hypothetical protein